MQDEERKKPKARLLCDAHTLTKSRQRPLPHRPPHSESTVSFISHLLTVHFPACCSGTSVNHKVFLAVTSVTVSRDGGSGRYMLSRMPHLALSRMGLGPNSSNFELVNYSAFDCCFDLCFGDFRLRFEIILVHALLNKAQDELPGSTPSLEHTVNFQHQICMAAIIANSLKRPCSTHLAKK